MLVPKHVLSRPILLGSTVPNGKVRIQYKPCAFTIILQYRVWLGVWSNDVTGWEGGIPQNQTLEGLRMATYHRKYSSHWISRGICSFWTITEHFQCARYSDWLHGHRNECDMEFAYCWKMTADSDRYFERLRKDKDNGI